MTQITEDLELENFTYQIKRVIYNWIDDTVTVEVIFKEGVYPHSRSFTYPAQPGMIEANINALVRAESWAGLGTEIIV